MTQAKPPARPSAAQVAAEALLRANEQAAIHAETRQMVREIHDAWMKPHVVYGNRSLLDCVSELAAEASAGRIVGERLVWYGKVFAALGTIGAAFYTAVHWGSQR